MARPKKYRSITKCRCMWCGTLFERKTTELRRNGVLNRKVFCSRSCGSKYKNNTVGLTNNNIHPEDRDYNIYIRYSKKAAKSRGREFDLDIEYLKELWKDQKGLCAVTNIPIHLEGKGIGPKTPYQASLDRIDNSQGYVKGNVRFVALMFNYARNTFTDQEVINFCKEVVKK